VEQTPDLSKLVETFGKRAEDLRFALNDRDFMAVVADVVAGLPGLDEYKQKSRWRKYSNGQ